MLPRPSTVFHILILSLFLTSCHAFKEPDFKGMDNLRLKKFGINKSQLTADLHYYNPNKTALKLKKADGDAWVDDVHLGHFIVDTLVEIPAKGDFVLPVKMDAEMGKLLKSSVSALFKKEVTVRFEGTAKLGKGPLFLNIPIKYKGQHQFEELIR